MLVTIHKKWKLNKNRCYQQPPLVLDKGSTGSFLLENLRYLEPGVKPTRFDPASTRRRVTWLPQRVWPWCRRSLSIVLGHRSWHCWNLGFLHHPLAGGWNMKLERNNKIPGKNNNISGKTLTKSRWCFFSEKGHHHHYRRDLSAVDDVFWGLPFCFFVSPPILTLNWKWVLATASPIYPSHPSQTPSSIMIIADVAINLQVSFQIGKASGRMKAFHNHKNKIHHPSSSSSSPFACTSIHHFPKNLPQVNRQNPNKNQPTCVTFQIDHLGSKGQDSRPTSSPRLPIRWTCCLRNKKRSKDFQVCGIFVQNLACWISKMSRRIFAQHFDDFLKRWMFIYKYIYIFHHVPSTKWWFISSYSNIFSYFFPSV